VKDALTIDALKPVSLAKSYMSYFNLGALVVMEDGEPVGLITQTDIKRVAEKGLDLELMCVGDVASKPLIWVKHNTTLKEVAEVMIEKGIRKVPVFGFTSRGPLLLGLYEYEEPVESLAQPG